MYVSRTISVYEAQTTVPKSVDDERLHLVYDGLHNLLLRRETTAGRYAECEFWTRCKECHTAFIAAVVGSMPYAVLADFLEERRDRGFVKQWRAGDWDYVLAELRRWNQRSN